MPDAPERTGTMKALRRAIRGAPRGLAWRVVSAYRLALRRLAWPIYIRCFDRLALRHRRSLRTTFIGITGSAGKTTTKDLVAAILERHHGRGRKGQGTLNGAYQVARVVLMTRPSDTWCVTEIAVTNDADFDLQLALFRPDVGVVTTIGSEHVASYGSLDGVAREKSKLVRSLPPNGTAVLNADDPRVLAMRAEFQGRTLTFGTSDAATVRASAVASSWPHRLSFTVEWNGQSARVQTQLCGDHWVPVVLAALTTGVALGVPLAAAAEAIAGVEPFEGRMSPVQLQDRVTFIRDDWKAPVWSIAPTFDFIRQARAPRKIIVMGTLSDYSGPSTPRYVKVARQALAIADCVVFVGPRAATGLRAKEDGHDRLFAFPSLMEASKFLSGYLRPGDLVLLKGSIRTDHLERLVLARTGSVECWRTACRRAYFCDKCALLHVASGPGMPTDSSAVARFEPEPTRIDNGANDASMVVVVGLGNAGERNAGTRHNVGRRVVDILGERLGGTWVREDDLAVVMRTHYEEERICLTKLLTPMNDSASAFVPLSRKLGFTLSDCILVHDDLDLPLGTVRARYRGGDGGHRGVQSILQAFQEDRVRRVKVGIGKPDPGTPVVEHVLTPFPPDRLAEVDHANRVAADRVVELIREASAARRSRTQETAS